MSFVVIAIPPVVCSESVRRSARSRSPLAVAHAPFTHTNRATCQSGNGNLVPRCRRARWTGVGRRVRRGRGSPAVNGASARPASGHAMRCGANPPLATATHAETLSQEAGSVDGWRGDAIGVRAARRPGHPLLWRRIAGPGATRARGRHGRCAMSRVIIHRSQSTRERK